MIQGSFKLSASNTGMLSNGVFSYLAALAVSLSAAQSVASESSTKAMLEEVVVTAQKREQGIQDVPMSISAFSGDQVENRGLQELADIGAYTPGLHWQNISPAKPRVFIRGVGSSSFDAGSDPTIGIFIDEVYMARFASMSSELLDVERIEVLKGPQGTLFGRNAAGGAIHIITKRPTDEFNATFKAGISNFDGSVVKGTVSGPLIEDQLSARVSYASRSSDGYVDNNLSPEQSPTSVDRSILRGQLAFTLSDSANLLLTADSSRTRDGMWPLENQLFPDGSLHILQLHPSLRPGTVTSDRFDENYDFIGFQNIDSWGLSARLEAATGFGDVTAILAYRDTELSEATDFDASAFDTVIRRFGDTSETFSAEVRLASNQGDRLDWLVGLYYFSDDVRRTGSFAMGADNMFVIGLGPFGTGGVPFSSDDVRNITTESYAAFFHATYHLSDKLDLTFGARYTTDDKEMDRVASTSLPGALNPFVNGGGFTAAASDTWSSFDPSVIVDFKLSEDVMLYASYRQGFKSGGFQSEPVVDAVIAETIFDPEEVTSFEVGMKSHWFDDRLQLNIAAFYNDYDDLQVFTVGPSSTGAFSALVGNAATASAEGVEIDLTTLPFRNLMVGVNLAWLDSSYDEFIKSASEDFSGETTAYSPDLTANFTLNYGIELANDAGTVDLNLVAAYTDSYKTDSTIPEPFDILEERTVVDAYAAYTTPNGSWRFSIWSKNLTDEEYRSHNISVVPAPGVVVGSIDTWAMPRSYGIDVTWSFGD